MENTIEVSIYRVTMKKKRGVETPITLPGHYIILSSTVI